MSPLSLPQLVKLEDGRWQATCRRCGWQSEPIGVKASADYSRRIHGPEALCKRVA